MSKVQLFGLPNCDGTQAVIKWFEKKGIETSLHNYKTDGITKEKLGEWTKVLGWEKLLNKRSTTWRSLKKEEQDGIINESTAIDIMLKHTSLIKRPVIESGKELLIGFDEKKLSNTFK
ncbi:MAG TPA: Spx/MgsR family RNA polymerase-binding regulatory protein [Ferruginibacter sp.]|nr:Spx/MgsR family RNA polymerase-binding regulatory protein [Ferruginibacter sp.]HPH92881.1 Spx/MgsR family RNA polymerase-binding regulatory protein [Ferruginibacter sp.]